MTPPDHHDPVHPAHPARPQISLLVPFRADKASPHRTHVWNWLHAYWERELPDAEIVIGHSAGRPFSKTEAVNDAARKAKGRIFVVLDSDTYITGAVIQGCADAIDVALARGHRLWFVPYRHLYRLTEATTHRVMESDPHHPLRFPTPPGDDDVESTLGSMHGHRFGALIQVMPRGAYEEVGCWDPRFVGWGGEDIAYVRACDTLYIHHKTTDNDVLHLWHPSTGAGFKERVWEGQSSPRANERLANRYNLATGDRARMRALVNEGCSSVPRPRPWWERVFSWSWWPWNW